MIVNIHEAKTTLSRLLQRVGEGEEIVIAKAGQPIARLVPYDGPQRARRPGVWTGRVRIAHDFDELPSEVMDRFHDEL